MPTCVASPTGYESGGREDPEIRALLRAAKAGLDGARTPVLHRRNTMRQSGISWWFAVVVVVVAVFAIALPIRLSIATADDPVVAEGIWNAGAFVRSDGEHPDGRFLVPTVSDAPARLNTASDMKDSQRNAIAAAVACTKSRAADVSLRSDGSITGPSAGFMFALTVVDRLLPADLTTGKQIAGTGKVAADGRVDPVGMIAQKAKAAKRAGADLFFVPSKQVREARRAAPTLEVVGVRHLTDAVRRLSGSGCL